MDKPKRQYFYVLGRAVAAYPADKMDDWLDEVRAEAEAEIENMKLMADYRTDTVHAMSDTIEKLQAKIDLREEE